MQLEVHLHIDDRVLLILLLGGAVEVTIIAFCLLCHYRKRRPSLLPRDGIEDENPRPLQSSDHPLDHSSLAEMSARIIELKSAVRKHVEAEATRVASDLNAATRARRDCEELVHHLKSDVRRLSEELKIRVRLISKGPGSSGEAHDLAASVRPEDSTENPSAEWKSENLTNSELRRRKFEGARQGDEDAAEMGRCNDLSINSPSGNNSLKSDDSILKSNNKTILLYPKLTHGSSFSDDVLSGSAKSLNSSTNLDLSMVSVNYLTNADLYSGSENKDELSMFRRRASENLVPEIFDHSTSDNHLPLSFRHRRSHLGWMYSTRGFAIDSIVARSISCFEFVRDFPVARRSFVGIDFQVMAPVPNISHLQDELKIIRSKMEKVRDKVTVMSMVSYISGDRKPSFNTINNMEKLKDELVIIQSKTEEIQGKVGQLSLQGWSQYKRCNFKVSVYEGLKPVIFPQQRMLYDIRQMQVFEDLTVPCLCSTMISCRRKLCSCFM